jgi:methylated-DNA-[protein]-cysteine S-methyltransferase
MNTHYYSTFPTALGDFSVAVAEDGAVAATAFGDVEALESRFASGNLQRDEKRTAEARAQITAYLAREREDFTLTLAPHGSDFQQRVWWALRKIPPGQTCSYGELARELQSAPRAVGRANATNPICVIVPCHRVIGADGSLTGYAFGETIKRRLLEREGALSPALM